MQFTKMICQMFKLDYTNRNSSLDDNVQIPPHDVFDRNSTGLVTCGLMGKRKKKSNSVDVISSFINKIYKIKIQRFVSLTLYDSTE